MDATVKTGTATIAETDINHKEDRQYGIVDKIAIWMDDYCLDPIISLIPGGLGDAFSQIMTLPALYISIFKLKAATLSLAIIYNILYDFLVGLIPIVGDFFDFFNKSHKKNYLLVAGFMRNDKCIVDKVNNKSYAMKWILLIIALLIMIFAVVLALKQMWRYLFTFSNADHLHF